MLRSQGDFQAMLKRGVTEEDLGVPHFARRAAQVLGTEARPIWFTYRVRLGLIWKT